MHVPTEGASAPKLPHTLSAVPTFVVVLLQFHQNEYVMGPVALPPTLEGNVAVTESATLVEGGVALRVTVKGAPAAITVRVNVAL